MIKVNLWVSVKGEWQLFSFKNLDEMRASKEVVDRKITVGNYATVGDNATVGNYATVGDNAKIGDNAKVQNTFVFNSLCEWSMIGFKGFLNIGCKFHSVKEWERIFSKGVYKDLCKDYEKCKRAFKKVKKILDLME